LVQAYTAGDPAGARRLFVGGAICVRARRVLIVMVGDQTYVVKGSVVAGKTGREPLDNETIKNARFTARVLDEYILHSELNKQRFSAVNRALVFSSALSESRIEPWRLPLLTGSVSATGAKDGPKRNGGGTGRGKVPIQGVADQARRQSERTCARHRAQGFSRRGCSLSRQRRDLPQGHQKKRRFDVCRSVAVFQQ